MMRTNAEMRAEAWKVVRGKWFWRMLTAGVLLNCVGQLVLGLIGYLYKDMQIPTWTEFLQSKAGMLAQGLDLTPPSSAASWRMTGASAFELFIAYLFAAIMAFGFASLLLKAFRNEEKGWLSNAFSGYGRPLELTWLMVLMNLRTFLWSLLFVIPGIVAIYRYRQAWYLKAENPDWSASKCLSDSGRMMKGYKWRAFAFDLSYFGWFVLIVILLSASVVFGAMSEVNVVVGMFGAIFAFCSLLGLAFLLCYYLSGRTVFYREVKALTQTEGVEE